MSEYIQPLAQLNKAINHQANCEAAKADMKSYLLALDGSRESLLAAELAWKLAAANDAKVLAQTVIDSQSIWQFIGRDLPGIIGNGPYLAAHEAVHNALKNVSAALLEAYDARARGHKVESESVLDEGITLDQIAKRANENVLVIMGHRRGRQSSERGGTWHYSLAEHLVYICPKPLLIVQDECQLWKTARLIVSEETYDAGSLAGFLDFAKALKMQPEIYCIAPEESITKFIALVKNGVAGSEHVRLISPDSEDGDPTWECATDVPLSTLLVVVTQETEQGRMTCAGTDLGHFVHTMRFPAVVILPENQKASKPAASTSRAQSLSKKG